MLLHKKSPVTQKLPKGSRMCRHEFPADPDRGEKFTWEMKAVVCADMNSQLICTAIIHHDMQHDNPDFLPLLYKTNAAVAQSTLC